MIMSNHHWKSALTGCALLFSSHVNADTVIYNAIEDFPVLDAGEVPYYVDQVRGALAVDASVVAYRDRFAKAEVVFDGQPGIYQIVLIGLAENDGEAEYRLSVNGNIVAEATNPEVVEPFSVARHEFADIDLPAGAVIGVESLANSNEKIPENGEFAFARGRWTTLELTASDVIVPSSSPDLRIAATFADDDLQVGDDAQIAVTVNNADTVGVATGVVVNLSFPSEIFTLIDESLCDMTPTGAQCQLQELAASESVQIFITLLATAASYDRPIVLRVESDQSDLNETDNAIELPLSIEGVSTVDNGGPLDTGDNIDTGANVDIDSDLNANQSGSEAVASTSSGGALSFLIIFGIAVSVFSRLNWKVV